MSAAGLREEVARRHVEALRAAGLDREAFAAALAALDEDRQARREEVEAVMRALTHYKGAAASRAAALAEIKAAHARRAQAAENGQVLGKMFG